MKDQMDNVSYPQPPFYQKKVCLRIVHYYSVLRQRLNETFGDRVSFSLTGIPSYVNIEAVEYALSFTVALSTRLLLSICNAERMTAALKDTGNDILLVLSATPQTRDALDRSLDTYRELFEGIAERGGFSFAIDSGETMTVTLSLHRVASAPTSLREDLRGIECDAFAHALAYPL